MNDKMGYSKMAATVVASCQTDMTLFILIINLVLPFLRYNKKRQKRRRIYKSFAISIKQRTL